jgi:(p)ppGpp synthase/HD superfamily hydrolase
MRRRGKTMENNLEESISLAANAHWGQKDKAGKPYILHPLRVMNQVLTETEKTVAVLHDVVEDTGYTIENLRETGNYSEEILEAVDCVTWRKHESYNEYIQRVKSNPIAIKVKVADLEDNMDIRRLHIIKEKDMKRLNTYLKTWKDLTNK